MKSPDRESSPNHLKTTETSFSILEEIKCHELMGITELASSLNMPKSTVHRHVVTLCELGYIVKQGNQFGLSLRFLHLGDRARNRDRLFEDIVPEVNNVVKEDQERAQFMVKENCRGWYIHQTKSTQGINTDSHIGSSVPLYATAAGKSYLASLLDQNIDDILNRIDLVPKTDKTIIDKEELWEEIEEIREKGYAINKEEKNEGISAVGVAVENKKLGDTVGSISLSIPETQNREGYLKEAAKRLQSSARVIELKITYQ